MKTYSNSFLLLLNSTDLKTIRVNSVDYQFTWLDGESDNNYFTIRKDEKKISYLPSGCEHITNDSGDWKRDNRKMKSVFEFLNEDLTCRFSFNGKNVTDVDLLKKLVQRLSEKIVDNNKTIDLSTFDFSVSSEISKIYRLTTSESAGAYLKNSCMRPESNYDCRLYSGFYDLCNIEVIYKTDSDGNLLFRALKWTNSEGKTLLDRIYGTEEVNRKLIEYAKNNGFYFRFFDNSTIYNADGDAVRFKFDINENAFNFLSDEGSPYVDTIYHLTSNNVLNNYSGDYDLQSCGGDAINEGDVCSCCGCSVSEPELYNVDGDVYCSECYHKRFFYCEGCGSDHDIEDAINCDETLYCERCAERRGYSLCNDCNEWHRCCIEVEGKEICESCLDNYSYCHDCKNYFSDVTHITGTYKYVCNDCLDSYTKCEDCGDYVDNSYIINHNDSNYCQSCYNSIIESEEAEESENIIKTETV